MTQRRKNFCVYYVKCFNATKAYQEAYGCNTNSANTRGSKLLKNKEVRQYINELLKTKKLPLLEQTNLNIKKCTRCGQELPFTKQYFHANGKGGLRSYCKECGKKYNIYKKTKIENIKEEIKMNSNKEKESALITINSEIKKALELKKYMEGLKISDYVEQLLMENIEPKYFEILKEENDIKIQEELINLSYSLPPIIISEYESIGKIIDAYKEVDCSCQILNTENYVEEGFVKIIDAFFEKYELSKVIEKVSQKYGIEICNGIQGMNICKTNSINNLPEEGISLFVLGKNIFNKLTDLNKSNLDTDIKEYPIMIEIALKCGAKEYEYPNRIEIK